MQINYFSLVFFFLSHDWLSLLLRLGAMFDCRHKLDQIEVRYHKLEGVKENKRGTN